MEKIETTISVIDRATGKIKEIRKEFQTLSDTSVEITKVTDNFNKKTSTLTHTVKKSTTAFRKFKAEYLSVMFLSMALNRAITQLGTTIIAEFKRATESTTFWQTAIGRLSLSVTILKTAMGEMLNQALQPFADWLIANIQPLLDFIGAHGKLLAIVGLVIGAVTSLAMWFSILKLGVDGLMLVLTPLATLMGVTVAGAIAIIVGGIVGLIAIFLLIRRNIKLVIEKWKELFNWFMKFPAVRAAVEAMKNAWNKFKEFMIEFWGLMKDLAELFKESFLLLWAIIKKKIQEIMEPIVTWFEEHIINPLFGLFKGFFDWIANKFEWLTSLIKKARTAVQNITSRIREKREAIEGSYQFGGVVPATGLYKLHAGEIVTNPNFVANVTVNTGPISSSVDIDMMANKVSDRILNSIKRYTQPVTRYG